MHDPYVRQVLLLGIGAVLLTASLIGVAVHRQRTKWRKLRLQGHPSAKKREVERRARPRD